MKALRLAITGLLLASVLMLAGPPTQQAYAATLCVDPTGACGCYTTIQAAIDAAQPNDTITVAPGGLLRPPPNDGSTPFDDNLKGATGSTCGAHSFAQGAPHTRLRLDYGGYAIDDHPTLPLAHGDAQPTPATSRGIYYRYDAH